MSFCRILGCLRERLEPVVAAYRSIVEKAMGYDWASEVLTQLRAPCDPVLACTALAELSERIRGRSICVIGPAAESPPEGCDVYAGPEAAAGLALSSGLKLLYVTGDGDVSLRLHYMLCDAADFILYHLHNDNWHASPPPCPQKIIYTSQAAASRDCIVGGAGFTDGDRAAVIAMALGALEVRLEGFTMSPLHAHKDYGGWPGAKRAKLALSARLLSEAAKALGYHIEPRDPPGYPSRLLAPGTAH